MASIVLIKKKVDNNYNNYLSDILKELKEFFRGNVIENKILCVQMYNLYNCKILYSIND